MLNRKLVETNVYVPVSKDELLDAMAQMTLSRHDLKRLDQTQLATLAKHLNADVIVAGNIRKFNQERLRTNASRTLREGGSRITARSGKLYGSCDLAWVATPRYDPTEDEILQCVWGTRC